MPWARSLSFKTKSRMETRTLRKALNSLLPSDIVIQKVEEVEEDFHARKNPKSKVYEYRILNREVRSRLSSGLRLAYPSKVRLKEMERAARMLIGEHDFSCFRSVGTPTKTTVRKIFRAEWKRNREGFLLFEIEGNGFLKQMVRAIVGTLVEVGKGRVSVEGFREILELKDRGKAGPTAPARGLFLKEVKY